MENDPYYMVPIVLEGGFSGRIDSSQKNGLHSKKDIFKWKGLEDPTW